MGECDGFFASYWTSVWAFTIFFLAAGKFRDAFLDINKDGVQALSEEKTVWSLIAGVGYATLFAPYFLDWKLFFILSAFFFAGALSFVILLSIVSAAIVGYVASHAQGIMRGDIDWRKYAFALERIRSASRQRFPTVEVFSRLFVILGMLVAFFVGVFQVKRLHGRSPWKQFVLWISRRSLARLQEKTRIRKLSGG